MINSSTIKLFYQRQTLYNSSFLVPKFTLNSIVSKFDTIFDEFVNFTDSISSVFLVPLKYDVTDEMVGRLVTPKSDVVIPTTCSIILQERTYISLGQIYVEPYFNNFADYRGYTNIKAFIPFVGFVDIDVNECMGKWLQFRLKMDYHTGKGLYIVGVTDEPVYSGNQKYPFATQLNEEESIRIISTYECDIGVEIPLGASNIGDIKRNLALGAVKVAASVATKMYLSSLPEPTSTTTTTSTSTKTYDVQGRGTAKGSKMKQLKSGTITNNANTTKTTTRSNPRGDSPIHTVSEAVNTSLDILNSNYPHSSSDRPNDSGLTYCIANKVYLYIYRPKFVEVNESAYGLLYGYPCGRFRRLSTIEGYAEISECRIDSVSGTSITQEEIGILKSLLANGVIFRR